MAKEDGSGQQIDRAPTDLAQATGTNQRRCVVMATTPDHDIPTLFNQLDECWDLIG
jgi:hypothetical protein